MVPENSRFRYQEASAHTGLKLGTLRSLVSRNQIPYIRISPRIVVFEREALDRWLDEKRVPARRHTTTVEE